MNGRQLCWLLKERFKGDRNQEIYKQQEVHHLKLVKDNIPAYHKALDALLLEVTMPEDTMHLLYATQITEREQCKKIMEEYLYAPEKGTVEPSYAYLRGEVETHLSITQKRKNRKAQTAATNAAAAGGQAFVHSKGKGDKGPKGKGKTSRKPGVCNQWASWGSCTKKNVGKHCAYSHNDDDKGRGKGTPFKPKGRGKGKSEGGNPNGKGSFKLKCYTCGGEHYQRDCMQGKPTSKGKGRSQSPGGKGGKGKGKGKSQ